MRMRFWRVRQTIQYVTSRSLFTQIQKEDVLPDGPETRQELRVYDCRVDSFTRNI